MGEQLNLLRCIYYCSFEEEQKNLLVCESDGSLRYTQRVLKTFSAKLKGTEARFIDSNFFQGSTVLYIRLRFQD
jgi:hypothetical protein